MRFGTMVLCLATLIFIGGSAYASEGQMTDAECMQIRPVSGKINDELFDLMVGISRKCFRKENTDVLLRVSSEGGHADAGFAIFDLIKTSENPHAVTTIAYGEVASTAVIIFLAGERRLMTCNSYLYLHEPAITNDGKKLTRQLLDEMNKSFEMADEIYTRIVSDVTKISPAEIKRMLFKTTVLGPKEAVRLGFATGIVGNCSAR